MKRQAQRTHEPRTHAGVDLGGLFSGLGTLLGNLARMANEAPQGRAKYEGEIPGLGDKARGVFGVSVRFLGDEPIIERFGNLRETPEGTILDERREPLVDVFDEDGCIRIIAELPGAAMGDIQWHLTDGTTLQLEATGSARSYARGLELPAAVTAADAAASYTNGIFELTLQKQPGAGQ